MAEECAGRSEQNLNEIGLAALERRALLGLQEAKIEPGWHFSGQRTRRWQQGQMRFR
jgi:hypothetical protein